LVVSREIILQSYTALVLPRHFLLMLRLICQWYLVYCRL